MKRIVLLIVLGMLVGGTVGWSQESTGEATPTGSPPVEAVSAPTETPLDVEAATRAYLDRLTPEQKQRSDSYFEGGYWLQLWEFLGGIGIAALLLFGGLAARMQRRAERFSRRRPVQAMVFGFQYMAVAAVLELPLMLYRDYFREHQYGLATQTLGAWFGDLAIETGVSVVFASLLLIPVYALIRRAPRTWWVWVAGLLIAFLALVLVISPVYLDPLLNTYEPLADEEVLQPILSMARANGVAVDRVMQFDASRQTTRISGNVSGFAGSMAIRLNDNLLNRCSLAEIEAVMGHELGHYVLNHVYELLLNFGVLLVLGGAFVRWGAERCLARWGSRWQIASVADLASLPLLVALLSVFTFPLTPVFNSVIRVNEAEADAFGLNAAQQPDGFAEVALKLGEYRKLEPSPIEEVLFFDHPSGASRIRMAMQWKAEHGAGR